MKNIFKTILIAAAIMVISTGASVAACYSANDFSNPTGHTLMAQCNGISLVLGVLGANSGNSNLFNTGYCTGLVVGTLDTAPSADDSTPIKETYCLVESSVFDILTDTIKFIRK